MEGRQLPIENLHLIDDSDDEAFLTKRMLTREKLQMTLNAHLTPSSFYEHANTESGFVIGQALVIVDLYLNLEKGTDVIAQLTSTYPDLIVGMSTGSEDLSERQRALDKGAWFFIGKPLDLACVQSICEQTGVLSLTGSDDGVRRLYRARPFDT